MSMAEERARSIWLLSFGDVVTLLITFFIMTIALNKGSITLIQRWAEDQLDISYEVLRAEAPNFEFLQVKRNSLGVEILIEDSKGFERGGFVPSKSLELELQKVAQSLNQLPIFNVTYETMPSAIQRIVQRDQLVWRVDVMVAGHTDNDEIDPRSYLRNNWFLSTMRAQNVMSVLQKNTTLDPSTFAVSGYGEYRPRVKNDSKENKAKNRRIDIILTATFEKKIVVEGE